MKGGWLHLSVRARLTLWYMAVLGTVLLLYASGVLVFLAHRLYAELDRRLHDDVERAEERIEGRGAKGIRWRSLPHHHEEGEEVTRWVEVWSLRGDLLYRNDAPPLGLPAPQVSQSSPPQAKTGSAQTADGETVRVHSAPYTLDGISVVIRVARSDRRLRQELKEFFLVMIAGLPVTVGLTGLGGYLLARRALAPVRRMANRARAITAEYLEERLPIENPKDELGRLATVFNETLARLQGSFEALKRFTSDAAHELRTPLTAIRSVGEVALREARSEQAYREVIGSLLEEADRLTRLVDSLLTLSRADSGRIVLQRESLDLVALVCEVVEELGVLAEEKEQSLGVESAQPVMVFADRQILYQAILNLVDNAIKYSSQGKTIRVLVRPSLEGARVEVVDQGPGIAPAHQELIFERFYRLDKARSRQTGGSGLGLAIVRWAVEAHGGRIELQSEEGRGSTFRIRLPLAGERSMPGDLK